MKSKKGISPLIATVLLIGFTIVLAALVMRWGGQFVQGTTQSTGCASEGQIACVSDVDVEITSVTNTSINLTINLLQNANTEVGNLRYQLLSGGETVVNEIATGVTLDAFGSAKIEDATAGTYDEVRVIPTITHVDSDGTSCDVTCNTITRAVDITIA